MAGEWDFDVVRRPQPALPPPFVCVVCQRRIEASGWRNYTREPHLHKPPVCYACTGYSKRITGLRNVTRGDHYSLQRLAAVSDALLREAFNHGKWWNQPAQ